MIYYGFYMLCNTELDLPPHMIHQALVFQISCISFPFLSVSAIEKQDVSCMIYPILKTLFIKYETKISLVFPASFIP